MNPQCNCKDLGWSHTKVQHNQYIELLKQGKSEHKPHKRNKT